MQKYVCLEGIMPREMIVVPYDSNWANLYEAEKKILQGVFGDLYRFQIKTYL